MTSQAETSIEPVHFTIDPDFAAHFRHLKQVFLYINDQCNLSCAQCIYKPHVTYHVHREIAPPVVAGLLNAFRQLGALKLTILGGEPTLYGYSDRHQPLRSVIEHARRSGYSYLRLDTNGHFRHELFEEGGLLELDELAFSLDGFDPASNDPLRGRGSFVRTVESIRCSVALGICTSITCCIHRGLVERDASGVYGVEKVIRLGELLGVHTVNFHDLFKAGVPMDTWTGSFDTTVAQHVEMYSSVRPLVDSGAFSVNVRLPQCFVTKAEFDSNPHYYGFCPVKLGERVMVHSDGVIRICSNLICSSFGAGRFERDKICWDRTNANETLDHDLNRFTPCTNRSKTRRYGAYVPLCFSFKPRQREFVWFEQLNWDDRVSVRKEVTGSREPHSSVVDSRQVAAPHAGAIIK